jgi:hypothetical protein
LFFRDKSGAAAIITGKSYRELLQQNQMHPALEYRHNVDKTFGDRIAEGMKQT